ncbi:MAG: hypothetical protein IJ880_13655 [Bacilli bacterium]|nr:hypothetical protein [Bacilli bacterium]
MPNTRSSVDEQVVKMSFDNSNFDSNINESIKTLNSLDTRLGLLNKEDFSGLKNNISELANVFTVKGQIMLGVFTSLGNKIVQVGLDLKNKLFAGIKDGLGEYKLIIDSTQTIYQNVKKYASLDDVNKALDELNEYADLTIYNFSEMTRMIGMFTSAGVSLNKSVATIKGLANAAALVGANSEKAQIAWQAVSRAMSSGTFSNVTWRSLELSNIAGEQFNKVITEVARANNVVGKSGKNIDEMIAKYGSLRLTLSEGWLTKDIFAEAMQIMSKDLNKEQLMAKGYSEEIADELMQIANSAEEAATQVKTFQQLIETIKEAIGSGWAQSFRILIGDLDEAKRMFTRINIVISDFIDNNAKIRNELFTQIVRNQKDENTTLVEGLASGRENFEKTIENMMATVKTFFKAVSTGFLNIFPIERISAAAVKVLDVIQKASKALVLNQEQLGIDENGVSKVLGWDTETISAVTDGIKDLIRFFRGLASAVDIVWMTISQPLKVIIKRIPFLRNFFENTNNGIINLLRGLGKFGDKITVVRNAIKNTEIFSRVLEALLDHIDEIGEQFPVFGFFLNIFKKIKEVVVKIKTAFKAIDINPLSALFGVLKFIVTGLSKAFEFIFNIFKSIKDKIDWSFLEKPKAAILVFIRRLSDYGKGLISFNDVVSKVSKSIKDAFTKVTNAINNLFGKNKLKYGTGEVKKSLSDLDSGLETTGNNIANIWTKIKEFFAPIGSFFKDIVANADLSLDGIIKKFTLLAGGVGAATIGISTIMKSFSKVQIMDNFAELLQSGVDVIKAYQKEAQSKVILNVAFAIGILAASLAVLSFIPYEKLENGLVIFTSFISVLSLTLTPIITAIARFNESLGKTRKVLTGFDVLNNFVKQLGKFGKQIAKGINAKLISQAFKDVAISVFILVGAIAALMLLFKLDGDNTFRAVTNILNIIIALSVALSVLTIAITVLSKIASTGKNAITIFSTFFTLTGVSTVILSIAAAMAILVGSLTALSRIDSTGLEKNFETFKELLIWMGGIAAALSIIIGVINLFNKHGSKAGVGGVAIIVVSIAASVALMTQALSHLATLDSKALRKVFDYVKELLQTIGGIAALITGLVALSRLLGDYRDNTGKVILALMVSLVAVAGAIHLLGKSGSIDPSIVETLSILTMALGMVVALLSVVALVASRAKNDFSTGVINAISKVSIGIAAVIASIGVMTAGIAALFATLSSTKNTDADVNRATNSIITRLNIIADRIKKSLPSLQKIFYDIGIYAGAVFTSFTMGFTDSIISMGEVYNALAVKIVNLILDILKKVVVTLQSRKSDIKIVIKGAIDLIGAIITEAWNDVFHKNDNFKVKEEDMLKFLGLTGLTVAGGSVALSIADNFNKIVNAGKNLGTILKPLSSYFKPYIENLKALSAEVKAGEASWGDYAASIVQTGLAMLAFAAALALIKIGLESISLGLRQMSGETARYIRSDVTTAQDAFKAFFTDADYRAQTFVDALSLIGEVLVNIVMTVWNALRTVGGWIGEFTIQPILFWVNGLLDRVNLLADFMESIGKTDIAEGIRTMTGKVNDATEAISQSIYDNTQAYKQIEYDWTHWGVANAMTTDYVIDGAQQTADAIEEGGEAIAAASAEVGENAGDAFTANYSDSLFSGIETVWNNIKNSKIATISKQLIGNSLSKLGFDMGMDANTPSDDYAYSNFYVTDNSGELKKLELHKEYLAIINEEKEALANMSKDEQLNYILEKAELKGIEKDVNGLAQTYAAILYQQEDQTKITVQGIEGVNKQIANTIANAYNESNLAEDTYVRDYYNSMAFMVGIAEDSKDKIVGKKEEEAIEILKQEAMKRGMTEELAEETAKNLMAIETGSANTSEYISEKELLAKSELFGKELENFSQMEQLKTEMQAASAEARSKLAQDEYANLLQAQKDGTLQYYDLISKANDYNRAHNTKMEDYVKNYVDIWKEIDAIEKPYRDKINQTKAFITDTWANLGMSPDEISKKWKESVDEYDQAIEAAQDSQKSSYTSIKDVLNDIAGDFKDALNVDVGEPDLSSWDFASKFGGSDGLLSDSDVSSAIDAASDLKDGLEANRADLTPTFDLDQLASDANKANGIVMSSLMAAQNASIGDYINKDSELNPFMKDRWQNVYNFTQNNYSPKALSRIDIYRQTQRQLSMSRGF